MIDTAYGPLVLNLARQAIAGSLGLPCHPPELPAALQVSGASFVTLKRQGALRGCIGSLEPHRPLADDIHHNAIGAAHRDPRFPPLSLEEWPDTTVEVSILTPAEPMFVTDEMDLLRKLRPGVDGVTLSYRDHQATFLPQVWEQLPEPVEFIHQLKRKAGWSMDFWSDQLMVFRYQVQKFADPARNRG
ncbi:AmmeMemoRadiSam system protein A [Chitinivorax sp. B]|uniref:AmmeMemoRadiSam system protein A n=1 Tax=Chitinivorax sp. B TaxID=2502235 RepID=UPI0010F5858B|nr:AmmeMemoRadiSam system protein A [Chitinivorax sp. B]